MTPTEAPTRGDGRARGGGGGRAAWIEAGQDILRGEGASALKLETLATRTRLTTGSFYHHFKGMAEFNTALAQSYLDLVPGYLDIADVDDPVDRLRTIGRLGVDRRMAALDAAMRDWSAAGFGPAAAAVRAGDLQLLEFVARAFGDLGFDREDAELRATLLVASAVSRISAPWDVTRYGLDEVMAVLGVRSGP